MQPIRSGIPTTYNNSNFRSRLEARWAAFFDLIGWQWVYEPLDTEGYIPDFLIQGKYPFFVEVGPCITQADYEAKAVKADAHAEALHHDLLVVGVDPLPLMEIDGSGSLACGWLGEYEGDVDSFTWDVGIWARGRREPGQSIGIYHSYMNFSHRPFADDHENPILDPTELTVLWREAGNRVQWHP